MSVKWVAPGPAWLFCPADRPDRFAKASAIADVVILDLEDGVSASDRPAARQALISTPLDPDRTVVRVNAASWADQVLDLEALASTPYRVVMLPKSETREQVVELAPLEVIALLETPRGVLSALECAEAPNTAGVMWGAEDLIATLGGASSRWAAGPYRDVAIHARSTALLAASAAGVLSIDSVYLNIADLEGLATEAADAAATGFGAKVAIHPSQVAVIRDAYRPTPEETRWAQRVLRASANEAGVFAFDGAMVDAPVLRHAEAILRRESADREPNG